MTNGRNLAIPGRLWHNNGGNWDMAIPDHSTVQKGIPISQAATASPTHSDNQQNLETVLLRGGDLASQLRMQIGAARRRLIDRGGTPPRLVTIAVAANPASRAYRVSIERTMQRVDIDHRAIDLAQDSTDEDLKLALNHLRDDQEVTGILVLMPLPAHMDIGVIYEHLAPLKDVDGVTPVNAGRLHLGLPCLAPSTPNGGIALLDHYAIPIEGARAVVIGRSNVVGRPLAALLQRRNATVTVCHRRTPNVAVYTREARIVALAVGQAGFLKAGMVSPGVSVLDFGINVVDDRIVGDADFAALRGVVGAITPVPGGTGPITALMLAKNTIAAGFAGLHGDLDSIPPPEVWNDES